MARILIIDDDPGTCMVLSELASELHHSAVSCLDCGRGLADARSGGFDVVFLDAHFPKRGGLDILRRIREAPSRPEVIIVTDARDPDGAELAVRSGAWDYLQKPLTRTEVIFSLSRVLQYRSDTDRREGAPVALRLDGLVGVSARMQECFDALAKASRSDATLLICGETGTGKELFARAVHVNSGRRGNSFVVVDCAALPETLAESVLFGHAKGAFAGADRDQTGLVRQAHKGTLFLDEVGELSLSIQKNLLRVLQVKRFRTVGGRDEMESDFRLVAATNRNIEEMVNSGRLRLDLLFRLRALTIDLPPLRERREDIQALVFHFLPKICNRLELAVKGFSPEFFESLLRYGWPGNVRELENALDSAVSSARHESTLFPKHLPVHIRVRLARESVENSSSSERKGIAGITSAHTFPTLKSRRKKAAMDAEKQYLQDLLSHCGGDLRKASRLSALSRSRLYELLKMHRLHIAD